MTRSKDYSIRSMLVGNCCLFLKRFEDLYSVPLSLKDSRVIFYLTNIYIYIYNDADVEVINNNLVSYRLRFCLAFCA